MATPFVAPKKLAGLDGEAERSLLAVLQQAQSAFEELSRRPVVTPVQRGQYVARVGELVRCSPPPLTGMGVLLPAATTDNASKRVSLLIETPGTVRVSAVTGTVNGAAAVTFDAVGLVELVSNGATGWVSEHSVGSGDGAAAPTDAEYIVGAEHDGLSAERVLAPSTFITPNFSSPSRVSLDWAGVRVQDTEVTIATRQTIDFTTGGFGNTLVPAVIDDPGDGRVFVLFALPTRDWGDISSTSTSLTIDNNAVTDAKLRDSAALSVIGRASNSSGDPADIVATTAHHVLKVNAAGTALVWEALALAAFPTIGDDTFLTNTSGGPAVPSAKSFSSLAGDGISYDAVNHELDWDGLAVRENGVLIGTRRILDFVDSSTIAWTLTDDAGNALVELVPSVVFGSIGDAHLDVDAVTTTKIIDDAVTNAKLANMAARRIKLRADGAGTGDPTDGTGAQAGEILRFATAITDTTTTGSTATYALNEATNHVLFFANLTATLHGATVPAEEGQEVVWSVGRGQTTAFYTFANESASAGAATQRFNNPLNKDITITAGQAIKTRYLGGRWRVVAVSDISVFTSAAPGIVPASGGGTTNFLRADGSWAAPTAVLGDADYGDITVSSSGTVWNIDANAVTNAELQDMGDGEVKLRPPGAGSGDPQNGAIDTYFQRVIRIDANFDAADAAYTITPPTGATWFVAELVGGGGGGGGADADTDGEVCAGGGGGAGGWCRYTAAIVSGNITGVVGASGAGGSNAGGNGGNGTATTLVYNGVTVSSGFGVGGTGQAAGPTAATSVRFTAGGDGGVPSISISAGAYFDSSDGGDGAAGIMFSTGTTETNAGACGGHGGASHYGDGGKEGIAHGGSATQAGFSAAAKGSGGGGGARISTGAASTGATGGSGQIGTLKVTFYSGPVPTFSTIT